MSPSTSSPVVRGLACSGQSTKKGGNFLILDEPTNDLDLPSLRMLEESLVRYNGSALVVSHDRFFLDRICDEIVAFEPEGIRRHFGIILLTSRTRLQRKASRNVAGTR